jgi:hypothetical protein
LRAYRVRRLWLRVIAAISEPETVQREPRLSLREDVVERAANEKLLRMLREVEDEKES